MNKKTTYLLAGALASAAALNTANAEGPEVSGSVSLDFNTHFISYGFDVWGQGGSWDDLLFNPSVGIDLNWGDFGIYSGLWFDINDNAPDTIGGRIQELDWWIGAYYTMDAFTIDIAWQEWIYGGQMEGVFDVALSMDTTEFVGINLSPTIKTHTRFHGGAGLQNGWIVDLGVSYDELAVGDLSISIPLNAGFSLTEDYHTGAGSNAGDTGLAYFTVGAYVSYPLAFLGDGWDVHGGISAWYTPEEVTGNGTETFLTGSFGTGVSF